MRSPRDLSRDMIFSAMFNFNARRWFAWTKKEIWLSDRPSLDPDVIPEDIVETLATRMPLTHLVDQRPHHLPQTNGTNVTIGQDTYTVLGEYFLKRNHQTGELQAGQYTLPLTASNKHMFKVWNGNNYILKIQNYIDGVRQCNCIQWGLGGSIYLSQKVDLKRWEFKWFLVQEGNSRLCVHLIFFLVTVTSVCVCEYMCVCVY